MGHLEECNVAILSAQYMIESLARCDPCKQSGGLCPDIGLFPFGTE